MLEEVVSPAGLSIRLKRGPQRRETEPVTYRIAGLRVLCDEVLDELAPFRTAEKTPEPWKITPPEAGDTPLTVYRDRGWVGGRLAAVECTRDEAGYRLEVGGAGPLWISMRGRRIFRLRDWEPADPGWTVQALLGPALCLALALQDIFCLHAAAVDVGGVAVALLGESGEGKSTLSSRLGDATALGWRRAADDVLPVASSGESWEARPHFPQLKLSAGEQWRSAWPEGVPLAGIYVLSLLEGRSQLELARLSPRDGALALIRHTVAGRLFAPELRARHLDFSAGLAARLPVRRLHLPRGASLPDRLVSSVQADRERVLGSS